MNPAHTGEPSEDRTEKESETHTGNKHHTLQRTNTTGCFKMLKTFICFVADMLLKRKWGNRNGGGGAAQWIMFVSCSIPVAVCKEVTVSSPISPKHFV